MLRGDDHRLHLWPGNRFPASPTWQRQSKDVRPKGTVQPGKASNLAVTSENWCTKTPDIRQGEGLDRTEEDHRLCCFFHAWICGRAFSSVWSLPGQGKLSGKERSLSTWAGLGRGSQQERPLEVQFSLMPGPLSLEAWVWGLKHPF